MRSTVPDLLFKDPTVVHGSYCCSVVTVATLQHCSVPNVNILYHPDQTTEVVILMYLGFWGLSMATNFSKGALRAGRYAPGGYAAVRRSLDKSCSVVGGLPTISEMRSQLGTG